MTLSTYTGYFKNVARGGTRIAQESEEQFSGVGHHLERTSEIISRWAIIVRQLHFVSLPSPQNVRDCLFTLLYCVRQSSNINSLVYVYRL